MALRSLSSRRAVNWAAGWFRRGSQEHRHTLPYMGRTARVPPCQWGCVGLGWVIFFHTSLLCDSAPIPVWLTESPRQLDASHPAATCFIKSILETPQAHAPNGQTSLTQREAQPRPALLPPFSAGGQPSGRSPSRACAPPASAPHRRGERRAAVSAARVVSAARPGLRGAEL